jgi:hypothetical protein
MHTQYIDTSYVHTHTTLHNTVEKQPIKPILHTLIHAHTHTFTYMHRHRHTQTHTCTHTHTHTHIHTYMYIYTTHSALAKEAS